MGLRFKQPCRVNSHAYWENHSWKLKEHFTFKPSNDWQGFIMNTICMESERTCNSIYLVYDFWGTSCTAWWLQPLWRISVSWDEYSQYVGKMFQTTNRYYNGKSLHWSLLARASFFIESSELTGSWIRFIPGFWHCSCQAFPRFWISKPSITWKWWF